MMKKLLQLVLMIMLVMGMSVASQAGTIAVGSATGDPGTQVSIPVTINMADGVKTSCSFSIAFDKTKLQYASKTSGDMGASLLIASTADINAAGKVQPIVTFEDGGPTSGTIVTFKFNILTGAAAGATPLTTGDLTAAPATPALTGTSGSVTINAAACTGPTITVGTDTACEQGDTVEIPVTVDSTNSQPDASFSVSFDKTKLQFTGTAAGTMNAEILIEKTDEINAAGKAGIIARFATATSGTIVKLKFTALAALTADLPLTIGDIIPSDKFCGEDGAVEQSCIPACSVTIGPTTATVTCGSFKQFTSTTTGTCGALTWSVVSSIGSNVTQGGLYRAGTNETGASVHDTVNIKSSSSEILASAVVTVPDCTGTTVCTVNIIPESETVDCGNTVNFSAITTGTGCATPVYTWSVVSTIGSTINQTTGLYTAGENTTGTSKTDKVRVTDTANNVFDTATVIVPDCTVVCLALTVDPTESAQGQTLKVKLSSADKIFKNVNKDDIIVDFGSGITVNKITDKSEGSIKVEITIDANATVGTRTVLVTVSDTVCGEGTFGVTKAPVIVIAPPYGNAGATIENVTITGRDTHFAKGKSKVKFGKNIEVSNKVVVDENTITVKIKIGKKAVVGSRAVTVTTKLGDELKEIATGNFVVLPAATE